MSQSLQMTDLTTIGENDYYRFAVAKIGERWVGFAMETAAELRAKKAFADAGLPIADSGAFIFGQVAENFQLGLVDRDRAILLTGAIAQDPESAYGGIDHWHVADHLRGRPEDYRCRHCGAVGCDGVECEVFDD